MRDKYDLDESDQAAAVDLGANINTRPTDEPTENYAPTSKAPRPSRTARKCFKKNKAAARSGAHRRREKKIQW